MGKAEFEYRPTDNPSGTGQSVARCVAGNNCHVRNPKDFGPNGRPRFNYADDSKKEKKTARLMYTMVDTINVNFVSKVPNSGIPVSCGTCHRGHLALEPYTGVDSQKSATPAAPTSTH
jgi:hypothetical protein